MCIFWKSRRFVVLALSWVVLAGCSTTDVTQQSASGNPVVRLEIISLHRSSNRQVQSFGSGFFITRDGYLLTNDHVVNPVVESERCKSQSIKVRINAGQRGERVVSGKVVAFDHAADLAVVKISGLRNRPTLSLSESGMLPQGSTVRAQGYPGGGPYKETKGTVIGTVPANAQCPTGIMFCSTPVQPGNSGGPVLDDRSKVVGVAVAISDVRFLEAVKQVQDAAASALSNITAALEQAKRKMEASGDKNGYADQLGALAAKGKQSLREHAERSWILEEAVKHPNKTHVIDIADARRFLAKRGVSVGD